MLTSAHVKILCNVDIRTDRSISAHRPDIVIRDSLERSAILIYVAIPADVNIIDTEREKILKYVDLRLHGATKDGTLDALNLFLYSSVCWDHLPLIYQRTWNCYTR